MKYGAFFLLWKFGNLFMDTMVLYIVSNTGRIKSVARRAKVLFFGMNKNPGRGNPAHNINHYEKQILSYAESLWFIAIFRRILFNV